jgi:hypothetical protein
MIIVEIFCRMTAAWNPTAPCELPRAPVSNAVRFEFEKTRSASRRLFAPF